MKNRTKKIAMGTAIGACAVGVTIGSVSAIGMASGLTSGEGAYGLTSGGGYTNSTNLTSGPGNFISTGIGTYLQSFNEPAEQAPVQSPYGESVEAASVQSPYQEPVAQSPSSGTYSQEVQQPAQTYEETPIYNMQNPTTGEVVMTSNLFEVEALTGRGFVTDNIKMHPGGARPVYRLSTVGDQGEIIHTYTSDLEVRESLRAQGWYYEGIPFYL